MTGSLIWFSGFPFYRFNWAPGQWKWFLWTNALAIKHICLFWLSPMPAVTKSKLTYLFFFFSFLLASEWWLALEEREKYASKMELGGPESYWTCFCHRWKKTCNVSRIHKWVQVVWEENQKLTFLKCLSCEECFRFMILFNIHNYYYYCYYC